jgi:hypothetical protein
MKARIIDLAGAVLAAALLGGCAGGGGRNEELVVDTQEELIVCFFLPWLCAIAGDLAAPSAGAAARAAPAFTSWSELNVAPATLSGGLTAHTPYGSSASGIAPLASEIHEGASARLQYDAEGRAAQIALIGGPTQPARTIGNLSGAGRPWLDYALANEGSAARQVELAANPHALGWNYQSFGVWDGPNTDWRSFAASSYGAVTPGAAVPSTGSATFTGKLGGMYVSPAGQGSFAAAEVAVAADFSRRSLAFSSSGTTLIQDLSRARAAPGLDLSGTLTYAPGSGSFSGTLTNAGGTMSGSSQGRFYGPAAQELGGVLSVRSASTVETFTGAYGAKR